MLAGSAKASYGDDIESLVSKRWPGRMINAQRTNGQSVAWYDSVVGEQQRTMWERSI
jgi:hypothetical protein